MSAPTAEHRCRLEQAPRPGHRGEVRTRSWCSCGAFTSQWYVLGRYAVEAGSDHMNEAHR